MVSWRRSYVLSTIILIIFLDFWALSFTENIPNAEKLPCTDTIPLIDDASFQKKINCSSLCTCRPNIPEDSIHRFFANHDPVMGGQYRAHRSGDLSWSEHFNFLLRYYLVYHTFVEIQCVLSDGLQHSIMSLVNGAENVMDISLEVRCMKGEVLVWDLSYWQMNFNILDTQNCTIVGSEHSKIAFVPLNIWILNIEKGGDDILDLLEIGVLLNMFAFAVSGYRGGNVSRKWRDDFLSVATVISLKDNNLDDFYCPMITARLKALNLQHNQLVHIPECIMEEYGKQLQYLNLANNQISNISALLKISEIEPNVVRIINLSFNKIQSVVPIGKMDELSVLDLSYNAIEHISEDAFVGLTNLKHLFLQHNQLHAASMSWSRGSSLLQKLDLSYNKISTVWSEPDHDLARNTTIDLRYNRLRLPPFKRCGTLENDETVMLKVHAAGNPFTCNCSLIDFESCPASGTSLMNTFERNLYLDHPEWECHTPDANRDQKMENVFTKESCTVTQDCPPPCSCTLLNEQELVINCSHRQLQEMPKKIPSRANSTTILHLDHNYLTILKNQPYLPTLSRLYAHNCQIRTVTPEAIQSLQNVSVLTLHKNRLRQLPASANHLVEKLNTNLTLHNNRWLSSFNFNWLPSWVLERNSLVWAPGYLVCKYITRKAVEQQAMEDGEEFAMILVGLIIIISTVFILVEFRWRIRVMLYQYLGVRLFNSFSYGDIYLPYDVFVIYSSKDFQWIVEDLVPRLEDQQRYRTCLHYRDFPPEARIVDNIDHAIQLSRCVVLLLTNNFLAKEWKIPGVRTIFKFLLLASDRLVVIVGQDLDMRNAPLDLQAYMNTHDHFRVEDPYFWNALYMCLPTPR